MRSEGPARRACAMLIIASLALPGIADAQEQVAAAAPAPVYLVDSASPFGKLDVSNDEVAKLEMPKLSFKPSTGDEQNYDKYYYFHRADTDYATAYGDVIECDGYARGLQSSVTYTYVNPYPFTGVLPAALGSAIGSAMAAAIFGSGEKRRMRRMNMRQCMNVKGYQRYGLSKDLWEVFNFEEGLSTVQEQRRFDNLKRQALVASSATPEGKELGL